MPATPRLTPPPMKRFLVSLVVLMAVLAGVGAYLLRDANIKRYTETWLSAQMGRQIKVEGAFAARIGNPLRLTAESVRLANPDWVGTEPMATAARVEAAIDPWTILGDAPLILEQLTIHQLDGELVSDEKGRANWQFGSPDSAGANFLIRGLDITDTSLTIRRPGFEAIEFAIESLSQSEAKDGLLQTTLRGEYNKRPVSADGQLGPFKNLLAGSNVRFALNASIGTLQVKGIGLLDDLSHPRQPKVQLDANAPSAAEVAEMFAYVLDATQDSGPGAIKLSLEIKPQGGGVSINGGGQWGNTELSIDGQAEDLSGLDGIDLRAAGNGPSLRNAVRLFGFRNFPNEAFKFSGNVSRNGEKLDIQEMDLTIGGFLFQLHGSMSRFPKLNDADLELKIEGDDVARFREVFGLPGIARGKFSLAANLGRNTRGTDVFRVRAHTELGKALVSGTIGPAPDYVGSTAIIRGDGVNFGHVGELLGVKGLKELPFRLTASLEKLKDGFRLEKGAGLEVGDAAVQLSGVLGADPLQAGTQLDWTLSGVDLADLARVARLTRDFPARPLSATGSAMIRPADIVFTNVKGTIGKSDFSLSGQVGRLDQLRGTDLRVALRGPDLTRLAFLVDDFELPAGPFDISGRIQRTAAGLRVSDSVIDVAGAKGKANIDLDLPVDPVRAEFDIEVQGPDAAPFWKDRWRISLAPQAFVVDVQGQLNDDLWEINQGVVTLGETTVTIDGHVRRNEGQLQIKADSPKISALGTFMGREFLPGRSLQLSGSLQRKDSEVRIERFLARTNEGDLAGSFSYTPGQPPSVHGDLTSRRLDISWLTDPVKDKIKGKEEAAEKARPKDDGLVIPDWTLPLELLKRLNADLSVSADQVVRQRRDVRNFIIRLLIHDGALTVAPWRFGGGSGSLDGTLRVAPATEGANVAVRLLAKDLVTGLFEPDNEDLSAVPKGDWNVNVHSRGNTLRELAANLQGTGQLVTSAGRLKNSRSQDIIFGNFFKGIVSAVNPFVEKEPYTEIACAVFPFTFKNGVMKTAPSVAVQTDKLNILSHGTVDLKTERLDLSFNSKPRGGLGLSAGSIVNPFVRIGGTLAKPSITLDKTGALMTGGAAFFTAGLSLIAKAAFDAAWRSRDPCGQVLKESGKVFAKSNGDSAQE